MVFHVGINAASLFNKIIVFVFDSITKIETILYPDFVIFGDEDIIKIDLLFEKLLVEIDGKLGYACICLGEHHSNEMRKTFVKIGLKKGFMDVKLIYESLTYCMNILLKSNFKPMNDDIIWCFNDPICEIYQRIDKEIILILETETDNGKFDYKELMKKFSKLSNLNKPPNFIIEEIYFSQINEDTIKSLNPSCRFYAFKHDPSGLWMKSSIATARILAGDFDFECYNFPNLLDINIEVVFKNAEIISFQNLRRLPLNASVVINTTEENNILTTFFLQVYWDTCNLLAMVRFKIYEEFESERKIIQKTILSEVRVFRDLHTGEKVIGKIEHDTVLHPKLPKEYDIYMSMGFESGIPKIYHFGIHDNFNILIMEHLGPSLSELLKECGGKFNVKTVTNLAIQLINRMEYVHDHGIVHKDIKPLNFVMGTRENAQTVYIIDFNCSSKFINPKTKEHIPDVFKAPYFRVNSCYNSLKVHEGSPKTRRDDLEAISYILIYFLRGNLPWQHFKNDEIDEIYEMKRSIPVEELCEGLPFEFGKFLLYCRQLKFEKRPDYGYLRKCFESLKKTLDVGPDFEWL